MVQIFGIAGRLSVEMSSLALVGVVAFTVSLELATHRLEHRLAGTPFLGMLNKIYKGKRKICIAKCAGTRSRSSLAASAVCDPCLLQNS
jgi:hypothetical protein